MTARLLVGVDIGTPARGPFSSTTPGRCAGKVWGPYSFDVPRPGWTEQDPVMEGVAFGLRDSFEILRTMGVEVTQIRASGGGAASALWREILAGALGAEVVVMTVTERAAYGAALLAGVGAGVFSTVEAACGAMLRVASGTSPRPGARAAYEALYGVYRALYPALRRAFQRLAETPRTTGV